MYEIKENLYCFQYMFFYVFIILSLFYISILTHNLPKKKDIDYLIKVMDYWKKKPIWKITTLNDYTTEEPEDMEKYSFGKWPGSNKGCDCTNDYQDIFFKDSCSKVNLTNGCKDLKEEKPKNIYYYLFKYYVTYYDSDYLTLLSRVNNNDKKCKNGFKKCGALDTSDHPFCVKEKEECVINYFYFSHKDNLIYINAGFSEKLIDSNIAVNNVFLGDLYKCIVNEKYLYENYLLIKNNTDEIKKCDSQNTSSIYVVIPESGLSKNYLYKSNGIYENFKRIPGESGSIYYVNLYAMRYFGLNNSNTEYYYFDAFILKHLKLMLFSIFIFLKVGIQFGYFIYIQKTTESKKNIKVNIYWFIVFVIYFILIVGFNNSLYRTAYVISFESDYNNFYSKMKDLKFFDEFLAFLILFVHAFKCIYIYLEIDKKKYSEFINEDK